MKEPIIVTAFWDVGRSENCEFPRSNERYYAEFAEWARIKNNLIVYTDKYSESRIRKIRKKYGLEDKTIVIVHDIFKEEEELLKKMYDVEHNSAFKEFRYRPEAMENRANFNYAWFMKYWCMAEATKYAHPDDVFAWFDFGFNHMDKCYSNMNEFSFTWTLNREVSKIQAYSLREVDSIEVFDVLQFMQDTIMGVFFLVPVSMAEEFWQTIRQAMIALLMIGCIDDDQVLVLIAHKWRPDLIEVNVSKWWYMALKENGASHLSVKVKEPIKSLRHNLWTKIYDYEHKRNYIKITQKRMNRSVDSAI